MPTTSSTPAVPRFAVTCSIGPLNVSAADSGPTCSTISVSESVVARGSPNSPTIDTSAISAGNIDSTA